MDNNTFKIGSLRIWKPGKLWLVAAAIMGGVGLFILDEILFGAPIVALVKLTTPAWAFIILVPVYFTFDFFLGTATLNGVRKWKQTGHENKWSRKYQEIQQTRFGYFIKWLMRSFGTLGFIICSWLGTAFLTMPLVYLLGGRRHLEHLTALSALIYSLTFVGQYVGAGILLFN